MLRWLSGHLLGKSCALGLPSVLFVFCLFVIVDVSHFGFEGRPLVLISTVPGHCLPLFFVFLLYI